MLLNNAELTLYFAAAEHMSDSDRTAFLSRANAYCIGEIGGIPPLLDWDPIQDNLKGIVAAAFEIIAEGETAEVDQTNGNVTEAAPTRAGKATDPLKRVDKMLLPYKSAYSRMNAETSDSGFSFLGGL